MGNPYLATYDDELDRTERSEFTVLLLSPFEAFKMLRMVLHAKRREVATLELKQTQ